MSNIITYPDSLSLSKNLKRFVISSGVAVSFILKKGTTLLLDEVYTPLSNGQVEVDIEDIINDNLSVALPGADVFLQSEAVADFSATIDGVVKNFRVVKGGTENLSVTPPEFLKTNFHTWQPQTKSVTALQPEWLSYYAVDAVTVKCKFYNASGSTTIINLADIAAGEMKSVNVQFSRIINLNATKKLAYYDVWAENASGMRFSYIQRYILKANTNTERYFIFENSIGGLDTLCCTGEEIFSPDTEFQTAELGDETIQTDVKFDKWRSKSTGFKGAYEALWLQDFFRSRQRFVVEEGCVRRIVLQETSIEESSREAVKEFTFKYRLAADKGLMSMSRAMDIPAEIQIPTAEQIFFLAPRLNEFPEANINDLLVIPVQSPFESAWKRLSVGALISTLKAYADEFKHKHGNFPLLEKFSISPSGKLLFDGAEIAGGAAADHDHAGKIIRPGAMVIPGEPPADLLAKVKPGEALFHRRSAGFGGAVPGPAGVSSYADITEKPKIGGVELKPGNNTFAELGISVASHNHDYSGIYASKTHNHAIGDVTGLQGTLDSKANSVHDHAGQVLNPAMLGMPKDSEFDSSKAQVGRSYMFRRTSGFGGATPGAPGVSSYVDLTEKPKFGGVELKAGNNTLSELGIAPAYHTHPDYLTGITSAMVTGALGFIPLSGNSLSDYYTKTVSDSRFAKLAGDLTQDFSTKKFVSKTLVIPGTAPEGLAAGESAIFRRASGFGGATPGAGGGVSAYADLTGKPQIGGVELAAGDNTLSRLGLAAAYHVHDIAHVSGLQGVLDGKQPAGNYALSSALNDYILKSGGTFTGEVSIKAYSSGQAFRIWSYNQPLPIGFFAGVNNDAVIRLFSTAAGDTSANAVDLRLNRNGMFTWNGNNVWHAGNFNPDNYLSKNGGVMNITGTIQYNSNTVAWDNVDNGFRCISTLTDNLGYYAGLSFKGYYGIQIRAYGGSTDQIEVRGNNNSKWGEWRRLWHSGNLNRSDVSFNVYDLYLNAAIRSESPVSFLNESMAQKIYTGGILASSDYNDAWAVPERGIFARGDIISGTLLKVVNSVGYVHIGPQNDSHCHFFTDRSNFWFNHELKVQGDIYGGSAYNRRLAYVDEVPNIAVRKIGGFYNSTGPEKPNYFNSPGLYLQMLGSGQTGMPSGYVDALIINSYISDVPWCNALMFPKDGTGRGFIVAQNPNNSDWGVKNEIFTRANLNKPDIPFTAQRIISGYDSGVANSINSASWMYSMTGYFITSGVYFASRGNYAEVSSGGNEMQLSGNGSVLWINYGASGVGRVIPSVINWATGAGVANCTFNLGAIGLTGRLTSASIISNEIYCDGWFRTRGDAGWFSEKYGGGIWMTDSRWIRTYNDKGFIVSRGHTGATPDNIALKVITGHDAGGGNYDCMLISAQDVATLRLAESDGTQLGLCGGDSHSTITSTHDLRFFVGSAINNPIYAGAGGLLGMSLSRTGDLTVAGAVDGGALCIPFGPPASPQSGKRYLYRRNA